MSASVRMAQRHLEEVQDLLFREDDDEHAVFLYAGLMHTAEGNDRLLVRQVVPVADEDFGPSDRGGYRQVSGAAVAKAAMFCEKRGLRLIWAHSHPGATSRVGFSRPDRNTHARAHPGLIALTGGRPVTSLVFGSEAVAGETWHPDGRVETICHVDVAGARMQRLTAEPQSVKSVDPRFARQVLMFGEAGQQRLRGMTVAVVGVGGGGSLLVQALAHLGVGRIIVCDFDRITPSNLSRVVGAEPEDVVAERLKVEVMRRMVNRIDPSVEVVGHVGDVFYAGDARKVAEADFVFSATDTMMGRFAFNAICHQYLIPGAQVGAKVVGSDDGHLDLVFAMHRPLDFSGACLECSGDIDGERLRREQLGEFERRDQAYLDASEFDIVDPSVITLNSMAVALAMLDFQMAATGLFPRRATLTHRIYHARQRVLRERHHASQPGCRWCDGESDLGAFARGDDLTLPLSPGSYPRLPPASRVSPNWRQRMLSRVGGRSDANVSV
jgi:hypothetical protein